MSIEHIEKRDGRVVAFDRARIERAIEKACLATHTPHTPELLRSLAGGVIQRMKQKFSDSTPTVENVQDLVERVLAEEGFFHVAKSYILYRKEHERAREERERELSLRQALYAARDGRIEHIKKRDGRIVDFDPVKIERVIEKACAATGVSASSVVIGTITDRAVEDIEARFLGSIPTVEDVQDVVERKIAEHGLFDVSKAYILYRKERERIREEKQKELLEKIEKSEIHVVKRDGTTVLFDVREITEFFLGVCRGYEDRVSLSEIIEEAKKNLYDGISTSDINKAIIMVLRGRIERDPMYSQLSAKLLFNDLYKDIFGVGEFEEGFSDAYRGSFEEAIRKGVRCGRLESRMLAFDFGLLARALCPERDGLLKYLGAQTLYDRYFLRDYEQRHLEAPQHFWMRVAMGLSLDEPEREQRAIQFYNVMSGLYYVPSTPTLFHAGTKHPQMSSCFLTTVEDDLHHIFKCVGDNAQLSKWSGGVANDWSNLRGTGAMIKSTNVGSQGVIPFLKIVDATTAAINRSGKRRGATAVYLETWHYDIESFLELRKNTGDDRRRTHDTNTANWIPDLFMERVRDDNEWTLFSPDEAPDLHHMYGKAFKARYEEYEQMADQGKVKLWKRMRARDLWRKMLTQLYETGHPWITFKDACNIRSPQDHAGVIHSSNLCTEITLNTSRDETAVCNLGSVNLSSHIRGKMLDREELARTVRVAVRMLDNVIDPNFYPTSEAKHSNLRHRPIGLGVMGFQDALYLMDMRFDSEEAVLFSDEFMEFISYHAILASSELAKERGTYKTYSGSKWDRGIFPNDTVKLLEEERGFSTHLDLRERMDWTPVREHVRKYGMRNSNCMAIAPTATNANINGCVPSIEPIYKNVYTKSNFSGEFTVINEYLVLDLKALGLWDQSMLERVKYYDGSVQAIEEIPEAVRARHKEVFEIDSLWLLKHAAYRGKWIDQSQSLNIFTNTKSGKALSDVYMSAWKMGLKTTYYLRTLAASGIEKSTLDISKKYEETPSREKAPLEAQAVFSPGAQVIGEVCESCEG
ncbi:MAG: ribonucleoside-diphosphate reductase subunit alpha [Nanoarchaeota archaeon]|nr:ribonucleoside-diphosphate reductase subunit alpha [Nanoarchaeota archaeon]